MGDDAVTADGLVSNWTSGISTPTSLNCTSNDISVATATVVGYSFISTNGPFTPLAAGDSITCTPGQTIFAQTSAQLKNNAQDRYNIGVWIANDPTLGVSGNPVTGTCFHFNLIPGVNGSSQKDGDSCGDMNSGTGLASINLGTLTIVCPAGQAQVTVNNCMGWENSNLVSARGNCPNTDPANTGSPVLTNAQAFRDGTLPETKSKCNCSPFVLPINVRGTITIVKKTVGGDGSFQFTSDVGNNSDPVVTSPFTITTSGNSGTQVIDQVSTGTYHITESTPPSDFSFTSLSCTAGNAFASASISGQTATITMGKGGLITCTYTNTQKTRLTLVKVVTNDNGGTKTTSDFPLTASGPVTISGVSGGTAVTSRAVSAGSYALSEATQSGYAASSWSCTGDGTQSGANITLATGGAATCSISNDDNGPTLTLVKTVTNDNGGTKTLSDFPLTASGPVTISGVSGSTAVTARTVNAGSYALSEQTQSGYTATSWSCSGGTQSGANITLALGGSATCSINNNDNAPALSIVKTPDKVGDTGYTIQAPGTATFTITVSNSSAAGTGTALGVTLTDTLPANLTWSSDNASCSTSGTVTPPNPPGDGLTHQLLSCNIGTLAAGASFTVHVSASVPSSFVQQPPSPAGSPIDIDGDLINGTGRDWAGLPSTILTCLLSPRIGCDLDKPTGTSDDSFGQGTKEDTPVPTVVSGAIPNNKSDLQRFYVATERFVTTNFLYLAWERVQAPKGTTNMDFELNQSNVLSANGVTPVRTAGDILIKYDLSKGGTTPVIGFHRWVTSGDPATVCEASNTVPCWGTGTTLLAGVAAAINTASASDPILAPTQVGSRTLDPLTFGEASIDLQTTGIFQTGVCVNFGQAYLKSRSSDSFTSEIKDFIAPIAVQVTNCAPVLINNLAWVSASNVTGSLSDGGQIKVTTP